MDRQHIQDHQVIERYLRGALTEDEERAFEEAYVADPSLLDEIALAEQLRHGVKALSAHGGLERAPARRPFGLGFLGSPQYAMAASVLLAVTLFFAGTLYRDNMALRTGSTAGPAAMRIVPILTLRSASRTAVEAPAGGQWLVLQLDMGLTAYDTYRAIVTAGDEQSAEVAWIVSGLEAGDDALVSIGLPPGTLEPGEYDIALEGRFGDWPVERGYEPVSTTAIRLTSDDD